MNTSEIREYLRKNLPFLAAGALLPAGIRFFYAGADSDRLRWILGPTTKWVSLLLNIPFEYNHNIGYINHDLRMLIAPSCSGVRFMTIAMAMLIFSFTGKIGAGSRSSKTASAGGPCPKAGNISANPAKAAVKKGGWLIVSVLLSYLFTIFVNGLRIIAALCLPLYLRGTKLYEISSPEKLHTLIGAVVYFASLLALYRLTDCFFRRPEDKENAGPLSEIIRKCLSPVFWYFLIVLGLPLFGRLLRKDLSGFADFAFPVIICCGAVLLLYALAFLIGKHRRTRA